MTDRLPSAYDQMTAPSRTSTRVAAGIVGVLTLVVGVVLLFHPAAAAGALALLIGVGLVLAGAFEIVAEWDAGHRGVSIALGGVLVVGGLLAVAWPGVTLVTLAIVVGLSLVVHGVIRVGIALAARQAVPGWGWLALAGAVNTVFGVAALVWPRATVLVLSLILGVQIILFAALMLMVAFWPRRTEAGAW